MSTCGPPQRLFRYTPGTGIRRLLQISLLFPLCVQFYLTDSLGCFQRKPGSRVTHQINIKTPGGLLLSCVTVRRLSCHSAVIYMYCAWTYKRMSVPQWKIGLYKMVAMIKWNMDCTVNFFWIIWCINKEWSLWGTCRSL